MAGNVKSANPVIDWSTVKIVVFDVDGTLYDQRRLRVAMFYALMKYYFFEPSKWKELYTLYCFRRVREEIADNPLEGDLESLQYEITAKRLNICEKVIRACVRKWIFDYPISIIKKYRFPYLKEFCSHLEKNSIRLVAFSDYPAEKKIRALNLPQMNTVCSTDSNVNALKPNPKGLLAIMEQFSLPKQSLLYVGDRDDRDGECARKAGVKYMLKVEKKPVGPFQFKSYGNLLRDIEKFSAIK